MLRHSRAHIFYHRQRVIAKRRAQFLRSGHLMSDEDDRKDAPLGFYDNEQPFMGAVEQNADSANTGASMPHAAWPQRTQR